VSKSRLEEIASLKEGWDSYGAQPVSEKTIKLAKDFIEQWQRDPIITPMSSGGLCLEWHLPHSSVTVEFSEDGSKFNLLVEMRKELAGNEQPRGIKG